MPRTHCAWCEKPFVPTRFGVFCSDACMQDEIRRGQGTEVRSRREVEALKAVDEGDYWTDSDGINRSGAPWGPAW
jgi:hypothetical protein